MYMHMYTDCTVVTIPSSFIIIDFIAAAGVATLRRRDISVSIVQTSLNKVITDLLT